MKTFTPYPHQEAGVDWIIQHPACGLIWGMGTGKTVTTLTAVNRLLFDLMEDGPVLVIAPKRVAEDILREERNARVRLFEEMPRVFGELWTGWRRETSLRRSWLGKLWGFLKKEIRLLPTISTAIRFCFCSTSSPSAFSFGRSKWC